MANIRIEKITKFFGDNEVLKGIDLDIKDGEFITLVGASGSGKSTLLRIIAGLEHKTAGEIYIDNQPVSKKRPKDRDLAMVFQSYALYPHMTVRQNMQVPLKMRGSFKQRLPLASILFANDAKPWLAGIESRIGDVAGQLQIEHLLDRKPSELSGGQCQRVALGRAMVREPKAFLMDEPLSNLDAKLRVHMRSELSQIHDRLQSTFVYVTHDQVEAMTMSDRIALLVGGELIQVDTPANMYDNPRHLNVAEFIGSPKINVLPAKVNDVGELSFFGQPLSLKTDGSATSAVKLAIRPEHVRIVDESPLKAEIVHIENMGAEFIIYAKANWVADELSIKVIKSHTFIPPVVGEAISVKIREEKLLCFSENGERLQTVASENRNQLRKYA